MSAPTPQPRNGRSNIINENAISRIFLPAQRSSKRNRVALTHYRWRLRFDLLDIGTSTLLSSPRNLRVLPTDRCDIAWLMARSPLCRLCIVVTQNDNGDVFPAMQYCIRAAAHALEPGARGQARPDPAVHPFRRVNFLRSVVDILNSSP